LISYQTYNAHAVHKHHLTLGLYTV